MFEAIHGSAPRMVEEGRGDYADPSSIMRACVMLLEHIGRIEAANKLQMALDICGSYECKIAITGRTDGASGQEYANYVMETLQDENLKSKWESYQQV